MPHKIVFPLQVLMTMVLETAKPTRFTRGLTSFPGREGKTGCQSEMLRKRTSTSRIGTGFWLQHQPPYMVTPYAHCPFPTVSYFNIFLSFPM